MAVYQIKVNSDYRWNDAQVAGRIFSKRTTVTLTQDQITDEILRSDILDITVVDDAESEAISAETNEINATAGAKTLAQEFGIDLANVTGSGVDGRITKADVEAVIDANSQS